MEDKKHSHLIAKIFLVIGLLDLALFIFFLTQGGMINLTFIVRFLLWVVLPILFIAGAFDKK